MADQDRQGPLPADPFFDGWQKGGASMKESCDGNAQQQAVVDALYRPLADLIEEHGREFRLNHDHLLHVLYPSQISYGPVTEKNADWDPGLSFFVSGNRVSMGVTREYR